MDETNTQQFSDAELERYHTLVFEPMVIHGQKWLNSLGLNAEQSAWIAGLAASVRQAAAVALSEYCPNTDMEVLNIAWAYLLETGNHMRETVEQLCQPTEPAESSEGS
jgi:hypothetical protein